MAHYPLLGNGPFHYPLPSTIIHYLSHSLPSITPYQACPKLIAVVGSWDLPNIETNNKYFNLCNFKRQRHIHDLSPTVVITTTFLFLIIQNHIITLATFYYSPQQLTIPIFQNLGETFSDVVGSPYYVAPEVLRKHYGPESDVWSAGVILYILLSGVPPFWAETEMGIFRQILQAKLDFESEPWPAITDSAKDLIRKMLDRNPKKRLTAHEVLCHPWIVDDKMAPDRPLDSAVLSRLKQFSAMNKLKKMALRVIAETLSEEEIGGLKELFKMIDTDNSGTITFEELKEGLRRVGSELMESEIKDLMDAADIDNSGTIDYGEFLAATVHLNKLEREENLVSAFSFFDKDGSGYITIDELQQACEEMGLGEVRLDEIVKEIDQDNDGQIDYGEFAAMMRMGNGGIGRRTMRANLNLGEALGVVQPEETV